MSSVRPGGQMNRDYCDHSVGVDLTPTLPGARAGRPAFLSKLFSILISALLLIWAAGLAHADEITEHIDGIAVEDATITSTRRGGTAYLRFKITNNSGEPVTLHSIRSPVSSNIGLVIIEPDYGPRQAGDLSVLRDETLNLASSHIRVVLENTTKSIETDSIVPFELVFRRFSMQTEAHIH